MKIDKFFSQQGFTKSKGHPNLYIKRDEKGYIILICANVDYLITRNATKLIENIKSCMS